jgi:hypothetical protein
VIINEFYVVTAILQGRVMAAHALWREGQSGLDLQKLVFIDDGVAIGDYVLNLASSATRGLFF